MELLKELSATRKRWLKAHKAGDKVMEGLWLRYGLKLKEEVDQRLKNSAKTA